MIALLSQRLGVDLPLLAIFEHPVVGDLAAHIEALQASPEDALSPETAELAVPRREPARTAPLSFAQHQLWFLEQWKPGAATYNVTTALRLRGDLDEVALAPPFAR